MKTPIQTIRQSEEEFEQLIPNYNKGRLALTCEVKEKNKNQTKALLQSLIDEAEGEQKAIWLNLEVDRLYVNGHIKAIQSNIDRLNKLIDSV